MLYGIGHEFATFLSGEGRKVAFVNRGLLMLHELKLR